MQVSQENVHILTVDDFGSPPVAKKSYEKERKVDRSSLSCKFVMINVYLNPIFTIAAMYHHELSDINNYIVEQSAYGMRL